MQNALKCFFGALLMVMGLGISSMAYAVATVDTTVTGSKVAETTIKLTDSSGSTVAPDPGTKNKFSGLAAGSYTVEVLQGGKTVGSPSTVALEDGDNQLRVNSDTGAVSILPLLAHRQQQQQYGWSFGVLGGWKETPYRSTVSVENGLFGSGRTSLEEDGNSLALEARYNFRRMQQAFGARLFLYGTYVKYFGTDREKIFIDAHGADGINDTGARAEEKHSIMFGVGSRWNVAQKLGLELMLGAHRTRVNLSATTDELGNPFKFSKSKSMWGPMFALGLTYPLTTLSNGLPLVATARWTRTWMRDTSLSGVSTGPCFGCRYDADFDGGSQDNFQVGIGLNY